MNQGFKFVGTGTVKKVETFTTKQGKDVVTVIVSVEGQYPQLVPVKVFGRGAETARRLIPGTTVRVSGRLGGRDWNGRVFGEAVGEELYPTGPTNDHEDDGAPDPADLF